LRFDFQMKILLDLTSFSSRNAKKKSTWNQLCTALYRLKHPSSKRKESYRFVWWPRVFVLLKDAEYANRRGVIKPEANFRTTLTLRYSFFLAGFYIFPVNNNLPYFISAQTKIRFGKKLTLSVS